MTIRLGPLGPDTALDDLWRALDGESTYMLAEPGERDEVDLPVLSYRVVDWDGDVAAGLAEVRVGRYARVRHRGHLMMGVRSSHQGRGIGRALLKAAVGHARSIRLVRLELTVQVGNTVALDLYRSCGFEVEGRRRAAMLVEGELVDEFSMGLVLGSPRSGPCSR